MSATPVIISFAEDIIMFYKELNYCNECGTRLETRHLEGEGDVPFCPTCGEYRFPIFNTAVSMIVMNETEDEIVLIKQYGKPYYILVAGYVNKGEDAEDAVRREVKEEMGLEVIDVHFNRSRYFEPSNTLMLNFTVRTRGEVSSNREVESYRWFKKEETLENSNPDSLAGKFLKGYLTGTYEF